MSLPKIGEHFGGRDHTTVIFAYDKIAEELKNNPATRSAILDVKNAFRNGAIDFGHRASTAPSQPNRPLFHSRPTAINPAKSRNPAFPTVSTPPMTTSYERFCNTSILGGRKGG